MATRETLFNFGITPDGGDDFFKIGPIGNVSPAPTQAQKDAQGLLASSKEGGSASFASKEFAASVIGGAADIASQILDLQALEGSLDAQAKIAAENARRLIFNAERRRAGSNRLRTEMLQTANNVMASNLVAAFASGLKNSGSPARANEAVRSQLDINRFFVFSDAESLAQEDERQAARFNELTEELKKRASEAGFGFSEVLGIVATVAAIVAAPATGGTSLALLGVSGAATVGSRFV